MPQPRNMAGEELTFPVSESTVRVRMVDTTTLMIVTAQSFMEPVQEGHQIINITDVAFLIESASTGQKAMFDLGVRKDYWNLPPVLQKRLGSVIPGLKVDRDTTEILQEKGVSLESICKLSMTSWHC